MRSVVVFPQPEGPSSVANEPRGTSKEMSSTAAVAPNRFVTWWRRRWTSGGLRTRRSQGDTSTRQHGHDAQRDDRKPDVDHGERGRASPVEVVDELEDADRRHGRPRREQEDDDRQRRHRADESGDESDAQRTAEHRKEHIAETAQARRAEAGGRLVHRAIDLSEARNGGLISDRDIPTGHRDDDQHAAVEPVEPRLVECRRVADPEEQSGNGGGHYQQGGTA